MKPIRVDRISFCAIPGFARMFRKLGQSQNSQIGLACGVLNISALIIDKNLTLLSTRFSRRVDVGGKELSLSIAEVT